MRGWINRLFGRGGPGAARKATARLGVEALEGRECPASCTWVGGNSTLWTDALNWANNERPDSSDDTVYIDSGTPTTITGVSGTVAILEVVAGWGGTLTTDNNFSVDAATVASGTFVNGGTGVIKFKGGDFSNTSTIDITFDASAGSITFDPISGIGFYGDPDGEFKFKGTVTWGGTGTQTIGWANAFWDGTSNSDAMVFTNGVKVDISGENYVYGLNSTTTIGGASTFSLKLGGDLETDRPIEVVGGSILSLSHGSELHADGSASLGSYTTGVTVSVRGLGSRIQSYGSEMFLSGKLVFENTLDDGLPLGGLSLHTNQVHNIYASAVVFYDSYLRFDTAGNGILALYAFSGPPGARCDLELTSTIVSMQVNHGGTGDQVIANSVVVCDSDLFVTFLGTWESFGGWTLFDTNNSWSGSFANMATNRPEWAPGTPYTPGAYFELDIHNDFSVGITLP